MLHLKYATILLLVLSLVRFNLHYDTYLQVRLSFWSVLYDNLPPGIDTADMTFQFIMKFYRLISSFWQENVLVFAMLRDLKSRKTFGLIIRGNVFFFYCIILTATMVSLVTELCRCDRISACDFCLLYL